MHLTLCFVDFIYACFVIQPIKLDCFVYIPGAHQLLKCIAKLLTILFFVSFGHIRIFDGGKIIRIVPFISSNLINYHDHDVCDQVFNDLSTQSDVFVKRERERKEK